MLDPLALNLASKLKTASNQFPGFNLNADRERRSSQLFAAN